MEKTLVKITNVVSKSDVLEVSFHLLVGNGVALWAGTCSEIGKECEVEVSLDDIFYWGKNIKPSSKNVDRIYSAAGRTYLTEIDKVPAQKPGYVDLITTQIHLYPTNV
ncbi:hypothetical protein RGV33_28925 [Pseudomonas sp. Bout1]|uniref:hypothetical protein n=1 Tax=Pseudomonas sp. Bout1 TaxID=3048600 RepID=UPI002AB4A8B9|nr:hypothetical protein [Pseudomonas sp. Bout1]MDY7535652.1 hypothetical protein [Pseudomonas sp. Bout1]